MKAHCLIILNLINGSSEPVRTGLISSLYTGIIIIQYYWYNSRDTYTKRGGTVIDHYIGGVYISGCTVHCTMRQKRYSNFLSFFFNDRNDYKQYVGIRIFWDPSKNAFLFNLNLKEITNKKRHDSPCSISLSLQETQELLYTHLQRTFLRTNRTSLVGYNASIQITRSCM